VQGGNQTERRPGSLRRKQAPISRVGRSTLVNTGLLSEDDWTQLAWNLHVNLFSQWNAPGQPVRLALPLTLTSHSYLTGGTQTKQSLLRSSLGRSVGRIKAPAADGEAGLEQSARSLAMQDFKLFAEKCRQSLSRYWSEALLGNDKLGRWGQNRCTL
jgi:hypothetical protein